MQNRPSLREYTVTDLTQLGQNYKFMVRAFNGAGYTDSEVMNVILADEPDSPSNAPYSDASITNESRIKVLYDAQPAEENGGSPILSYEL